MLSNTKNDFLLDITLFKICFNLLVIDIIINFLAKILVTQRVLVTFKTIIFTYII